MAFNFSLKNMTESLSQVREQEQDKKCAFNLNFVENITKSY